MALSIGLFGCSKPQGTRDSPQSASTETTPQQPAIAMITEIAASNGWGEYSLFLQADGTAMLSGFLKGVNMYERPVVVLSDVAAVAAASHTVFLMSNGSVMASGDNFDGRLGDGTIINRYSP